MFRSLLLFQRLMIAFTQITQTPPKKAVHNTPFSHQSALHVRSSNNLVMGMHASSPSNTRPHYDTCNSISYRHSDSSLRNSSVPWDCCPLGGVLETPWPHHLTGDCMKNSIAEQTKTRSKMQKKAGVFRYKHCFPRSSAMTETTEYCVNQ